jgi:hypothetical protein
LIVFFQREVSAAKLVVGLREPGIDLQRVAEFDDCFLIFAGFGILLAAVQVFEFAGIRVRGTGCQESRPDKHQRGWRSNGAYVIDWFRPKTTESEPRNCTYYRSISGLERSNYLRLAGMSLPSSNTVAGAEISFAIWGVFDPGLLQAPVAPSTNYTSNDPYGPGLTSAQVQAAYVLLQQAVGWVNSAQTGTTTVSLSKLDEASGLSIAGLNIYTPSPNQSVSQEFLQVSMPEPSYPAVLALDLLAVAGLMFFFRRRTSGKIN